MTTQNQNPLIRLYNPHSGRGGPVVPLPEAVRLVVASLDGKTILLNDALGTIQQSTHGSLTAVENKFRHLMPALTPVENEVNRWIRLEIVDG